MKNFIYIERSISYVKIYYARAKTKDIAVSKIAKEARMEKYNWYIEDVKRDIKELSDIEQVYDYAYEDYEG
jgi:hypothetical protein